MSTRSGGVPPFLIFVAFIIIMQASSRGSFMFLWVFIVAFVVIQLTRRRRQVRGAASTLPDPRQGQPPRTVYPDGMNSPTSSGYPDPSTGAPPQLPTIDVPRYPDQMPPLPGQSSSPTSSVPEPEPRWASTDPQPSPAPSSSSPRSASTQPGGVSQLSSDPTLSLAQLQLSRHSHDLQQAMQQGSAPELDRLLSQIAEVATRTQSSLTAIESTPEQRAFRNGLRRLERAVGSARGEDPPGTRMAEVLRGARTMGQDGRYA